MHVALTLQDQNSNELWPYKRLRYAVVFATAGTEDSKGILWPLVLDDIASSKRRTEHRIGLRPLRRDAASLDTLSG